MLCSYIDKYVFPIYYIVDSYIIVWCSGMGKKRYIRLEDGWYLRVGKWDIYNDAYDYLLDYLAGGEAIEDLRELTIITKDWQVYSLDDILEILNKYRSKFYSRMPKGIRRLFEDAIIIIAIFSWEQDIYFKNYDVLREAQRRGLI